MKTLILIAILAFSLSAEAKKTCSNLFEGLPEHFITGKEYFNLKENGGYRPHDIRHSRGLIVVTPTAQATLKEEATKLSLYFVQQTPEIRDMYGTSNGVLQRTLRYYKLKFEVEDHHFGMAWMTLKITGKSENILRYLKNEYARRNTVWVGTALPKDFIPKAKRLFTDQELYLNESW